jgi:cytochrome c-type protein NapC
MSIRSLIEKLRSPSPQRALGTLVFLGIVLGAVGVVGFEASLSATNTNEFCIGCHELEDNAWAEFKGTSHHTNASGKAATCGDCHVPHELGPKIWRKIRAVGEIYHHVLGTIDTPEKYDEHRMWMASKTWAYMKAVDSRECRNCHVEASWDLSLQSEKAQRFHASALSNGKTCIDCHKGLAHKLPPGITKDDDLTGAGS